MSQANNVNTPNRIWAINWQFIIAGIFVMLLAIAFHGIPVIGRAYPTGPDYGQMRIAEAMLETGTMPIQNPYFQLGMTDWQQLPGAPLIFALNTAFSGVPVFEGINIIIIFAAVNALGMMMLTWRIFGRMDAALFVGMLTALSPIYIDMMSWAAYPNIIALSLFPYTLIVWFDYWEQPNRQNMLIAALAICGTVYIHHVSSLWLGLTLLIFVLSECALAPRRTLRKVIPIAILGLLIGLPILLNLLGLFFGAEASDVLFASNRFDGSRVTWEWWSHILTPLALPFLLIGLLAFTINTGISASIKRFIWIYLFLTLIFAFGWLIGLKFSYIRALFFMGIPFSVGAAAFYLLIRNATLRAVMAIFVVACFAVYSYDWAVRRADFYEIVTPRFVRAMEWLDQNSNQDDVILVPTFYAFHIPRFVERPILVGLTPDLIGNPAEIELAADAVAVLKGLANMDEVLIARQIRYIVIPAQAPDVPEQPRMRLVLDSHPQMQLVFENADTLIYRVNVNWDN